MPDLCPKCGANIALVGVRHRCVERAEPQAQDVATQRTNKIGRPRIEEQHLTVKAQKPWEKLGMSERSWYRRKAETKRKRK